MQTKSFTAPDLNRDGCFTNSHYTYKGNSEQGWEIFRNQQLFHKIGPGYQLVKSLSCGICSTDIARPFLPYPLPQIIGHEVVVEDSGQRYCVEINASHHARDHETQNCPFCSSGLETHCPDRITLGINQLPGGFAPYVLVPQKALHPIPKQISNSVATLVEPLAAAIQALKASPPQNGDCIAVLGPRRLGTLILMALHHYRSTQKIDFQISALIRHDQLIPLCKKAGADVITMTNEPDFHNSNPYDIIYDTTAKPEGFELALNHCKRELHLKSTHGQPLYGMNHWADFVVDELALSSNLDTLINQHWPNKIQEKPYIYISDTFPTDSLQEIKTHFPKASIIQTSPESALDQLSATTQETIPRYNGAIVHSLTELDKVIRPNPQLDYGLVQPRGWIYLHSDLTQTLLEQKLSNLKIQSSRCGPFKEALELLSQNPQFVEVIEKELITHHFELNDLSRAMTVAKDSKLSMKVIVHSNSI